MHKKASIRRLSLFRSRERSDTTEDQCAVDIDSKRTLQPQQSKIGYLEFHDAESYCLVKKVCGTLNEVHVYCNILNSHIHNDYFGVFTYVAYGMENSLITM